MAADLLGEHDQLLLVSFHSPDDLTHWQKAEWPFAERILDIRENSAGDIIVNQPFPRDRGPGAATAGQLDEAPPSFSGAPVGDAPSPGHLTAVHSARNAGWKYYAAGSHSYGDAALVTETRALFDSAFSWRRAAADRTSPLLTMAVPERATRARRPVSSSRQRVYAPAWNDPIQRFADGARRL